MCKFYTLSCLWKSTLHRYITTNMQRHSRFSQHCCPCNLIIWKQLECCPHQYMAGGWLCDCPPQTGCEVGINPARGPVKYKTVSMRDHNFSKHPLTRIFFMPKWHPALLLSQNLTPKQGFAQKITPKSDRILEKVPYFLKVAIFWYPKIKKKQTNKQKQKLLFPVFLVTHAYNIILDCPLSWHQFPEENII